jgi:hypothetical protein
VPITAIACGSRITCSAAAAATLRGASRPTGPSPIDTKLMPKSPARPPACAIASFSASTMSRPTPSPGRGTDE